MVRSTLSSRVRRAGVRILADEAPRSPDRRDALRALAVNGFALSALAILPAAAAATPEARPAAPRAGRIVRDFASPALELIRLLREATEIEHALMLQYLYAGFSLKPAYDAVAGSGAPSATDFVGVAVQEMQHLAAVNRLLVALGAAPNLERQEFPYEPDIYPFAFALEPLGRTSLAKYVYAEAPADVFAPDAAPADRAFADEITCLLRPGTRVNHIGSLYDAVIARLQECAAAGRTETLDVAHWLDQVAHIKDEGERDHFIFFRSVFEGTHPGFTGNPAAWQLPLADPAYPARALPINPTAFPGHDGAIEDPDLRTLAWLGNLHYWAALLLLDLHFREPTSAERHLDLARQQMLGPIWSLARHLPQFGTAMPFDALSVGYAPGRDDSHSCLFAIDMLREAQRLALAIADALPADYPSDMIADAIAELTDTWKTLPLISAPHANPRQHAQLATQSRKPVQPESPRRGKHGG